MYAITYIKPENYKPITKEEYERRLKERDDYILDYMHLIRESLDGKTIYIPTVDYAEETDYINELEPEWDEFY